MYTGDDVDNALSFDNVELSVFDGFDDNVEKVLGIALTVLSLDV